MALLWDVASPHASAAGSSETAALCGPGPARSLQTDETRETRLPHLVIHSHPRSAGLSAADHESIEATCTRFFESFSHRGWRVSTPADPLTVHVFDSYETMRADALVSEGMALSLPAFYSTRTNRVAIVRASQPDASIAAAMAAASAPERAQGDVAFYAKLSCRDERPSLMHEVAHLLAYNSGLQRQGRRYPLWFSEGLAASFEQHEGQTSAGPGVFNIQRGRALKVHVEARNFVPLERLVQITSLPQTDWAETDRFYAQAWGLFHYLWVYENPNLCSYIRRLERIDRDQYSEQALAAAFASAFGDVKALERRWHEYIAGMSEPDPSDLQDFALVASQSP